MNDFFVYIIQSSSGKCYIGQTNNLADRLNRHNSNRSNYTKNKGLIYVATKLGLLNHKKQILTASIVSNTIRIRDNGD